MDLFPIPFWQVALETIFSMGVVLGILASTRALLFGVGFGLERLGWVKPKRLAWVPVWEMLLILLASALLGTGVKLYNLTVVDRIYSGRDVELKLRPMPITRKSPEGVASLRALPYPGELGWLGDHKYWLEQEGERDRKLGLIRSYLVAEARYVAPFPTTPSRLVLRAVEGYGLASRTAFLIKQSCSSTLAERIEVRSSGDFRELKITMPEASVGDCVLTVFRVFSKTLQIPRELRDVVTSRFE